MRDSSSRIKRLVSRRPSLGGIALASIAAVLAFSAVSNSDRPQELTDREIRSLPSADFNLLEGFSGLEGGLLAVSGTVAELDGPDVKLRDDGYVEYNSDKEGFPSLMITDVEVVRDLDREKIFDEATERLANSVRSGEDLRLHFTNGFYEVGKSYVFVVGYWDETEFSAMYGHDIESDSPVPGFANRYTAEVAHNLQSSRAASPTLLETLLDLAVDLNNEIKSGERTELLNAVYGPEVVVPVRADVELTYPQLEMDAVPGELSGMIPIEIMIYTGKADDAEFALVGDKLLGWYATNHLGYAVVHGYAPPDEDFELVVRSSGGESRAVDLAALGAARPTIELSSLNKSEDGLLLMIDLSSDRALDSATILSSFDSLQSFVAEIDRLGPMINAHVDGPEPKQETEADEVTD